MPAYYCHSQTDLSRFLGKSLSLEISFGPRQVNLSSSPSWQISTAHAQPFRGARDLAFCLKVPLDSLLVWASSEGSGETVRMRRLAWTFAARIGDKYQIRLARPICAPWWLKGCPSLDLSTMKLFIVESANTARALVINVVHHALSACLTASLKVSIFSTPGDSVLLSMKKLTCMWWAFS